MEQTHRAICEESTPANINKYVCKVDVLLYKDIFILGYLQQAWRKVEVAFIPKPGKIRHRVASKALHANQSDLLSAQDVRTNVRPTYKIFFR